jgi:hypothetical protein
MSRQDDSVTLTPEHATALVEAARVVQGEARSFGEDPNEGYLLLHAALADALRRRAEPDPDILAEILRSLAKAKANPVPKPEFAS